ncbi:MAG: adenylosuccinate lyase [Candidatus Gracilibacteria bacterium]|nr:adenylosuccinate lyase [Candidatus Gracilibacteria bacterium]
MNMSHALFALSPLDGRYQTQMGHLPVFFSEAALMEYRLKVEIEYLIFLSDWKDIKEVKPFSKSLKERLHKIYVDFGLKEATEVKEIERTTNHDVKAIEYYLKGELDKLSGFPESALEFVHFCCTSEDINNLSYALMVRDAVKKEYVPAVKELLSQLNKMVKKWKKLPMLSLTHGQTATPTTVGKELEVFVRRIERQLEQVKKVQIMGKFSGATGNWNAHLVAYPNVNWKMFTKRFVKHLKLEPNLYTTQIESHDWNAELFDAMRRLNSVLMDLNRDMWMYISRGIFKQLTVAGEIGSSTMPHKVNPINFENSEGNIDMANALLIRMSEKLQVSRMQRDLSDSTVQRSIGTAFGYCLLAFRSCIKGLQKVDVNKQKLAAELDSNWEVLAEPVQTVMRKYGIPKPYEKLKKLTRGKRITGDDLREFIQKLELPEKEKDRLMILTPGSYLGLAGDL